jgi:hypothetical protein
MASFKSQWFSWSHGAQCLKLKQWQWNHSRWIQPIQSIQSVEFIQRNWCNRTCRIYWPKTKQFNRCTQTKQFNQLRWDDPVQLVQSIQSVQMRSTSSISPDDMNQFNQCTHFNELSWDTSVHSVEMRWLRTIR